MPNYTVIGGGAYQPGSAAAKKAQELYTQYLANQKQAANASPTNTPIFTPPSGAAPSNFPSYAPPQTRSSLMGSGASLAPGPSSVGKGAFGLVPSVPNPVSTAAGAIAGNQANLLALGNLGTGTTTLSAGLAQLPYQLNLPNYMGNLGQAASNVASNLAGRISAPTSNEILRQAAERGAAIGAAPGSPNVQTNWLGVLGQTSEQLQNLGASQLQQMIAGTPTGQPFNVAGQQISPTDLQAAQYAANVAGAAPDPTQAAQANLDMLLRAIEAGKVAGFPGGGGGGSGGLPQLPAPGGMLSPVRGAFPYYGGGGAGGYMPRYAPTAPGGTGYSYQPQPGLTGVGEDWMGIPGFPEPPAPAYDESGIYQFGLGYGGGEGPIGSAPTYDPNFGVYDPFSE